MQPLKIIATPAGKREEWRSNIRSAIARHLPGLRVEPAHDKPLVVVGSGPSIAEFLPDIERHARQGLTIVAVKGAHDWLLERGVTPTWYVNLDPRDRTQNLGLASAATEYLIASRCPPVVFDHLLERGCPVTCWHSYEDECETWPELRGQSVVQGGTTSGLRAVNIGHVRGYRHFILYGFDSCLADDGETKRITGEKTEAEKAVEVVLNGQKFRTNGALAQQAEDFRDYVQTMHDSTFDIRGRSMLAAMHDSIRRPKPMLMGLAKERTGKRIMWAHPGDGRMASYRLRCALPAEFLKTRGWDITVDEGEPDILIVGKPWAEMVAGLEGAKRQGVKVVVDICDDHFAHPQLGAPYAQAVRLADAVTCATAVLAERVQAATGRAAVVIGDPIEFERAEPHANDMAAIWFGSVINLQPMQRFWPYLHKVTDRVTVVTDGNNGLPHVPWSLENLERELGRASVALLPTKIGHEYKSPNRLCTALAKGCWAAVEPHPAYAPWAHLLNPHGVMDGLREMKDSLPSINERVREAQDIAFRLYSPEVVGQQWHNLLETL